MSLMAFSQLFRAKNLSFLIGSGSCVRTIVSKQSGAFCPKPKQIPLGLIRVVITVIPGLLVGASISKSIANFLEENDLFVPSDDEDEDD